MLYDIADYADPLHILMALEGDDDDDDDRESLWDAGSCVTRGEREREIDGHDVRGASPAELAAMEFDSRGWED